MSSSSRFDAGRRRPLGRSTRTPPAEGALHVAVSRDPISSIQLMGVRGALHSGTVGSLAAALASVADYSSLHLDVTDLRVETGWVLRQLEALVEQLERRHVRLRLVGFDPQHPALADTSDQA